MMPPRTGRECRSWVAERVFLPDLERLVMAFGGCRRHGDDLDAWLRLLVEFSERWDFRAGRDRSHIVSDEALTPGQQRLVESVAEAFGMFHTAQPERDHYHHIVILGGLLRGCIARSEHAARLVASGTVTARRVIALSGFRSLAGDELEQAPSWLDEPVRDEFELMAAGVERAFGRPELLACRGQHDDFRRWAVRDYRTASGLPVHVVGAPSSQPRVRPANTPDTYAWLAGESGWLSTGDSILIVTTSIYAPYQGVDAVRMLGPGVDVDVIGIDPGRVDPRLQQDLSAQRYLQEIRSALRSFRALLAATDGLELQRAVVQ